MCWAFAFGIPVYFWWVSLKEKDRKKSFSPCSLIHSGYSPWITCGRDAAVSGATFSSFSSLLPFCFLPFSLFLFLFFLRGFRQPVMQEADSGGRTGWPASIWGLQGAGAGAFLGHLQQWLKRCHVPRPCPHPATTLTAHGCPSRAEMLPDAGPSVHLKCLTCEESFK